MGRRLEGGGGRIGGGAWSVEGWVGIGVGRRGEGVGIGSGA